MTVKNKESNILYLNTRWSLIFVICSFDDGQRFMRCCTEMHFLENNQHRNTKTKIQSFDQTKEDQQHENKIQEVKCRKWQTQTQKRTGLNTFKHLNCEFRAGTKCQKAGDRTKRIDCSSLYFFLHKFWKTFKACIKHGRPSPS